MNPQSLNKYSYCFNNPLKYNDPTGHWPNWAKIGQGIVKGIQAAVNVVKQNINIVQTVLDVAGMIPAIGEICDVASGIISVAKGDWGGAALSLAPVVPVIGNASGAAGDVHVFINVAQYSPRSIWATIERPALLKNPAVKSINYHSVGKFVLGP